MEEINALELLQDEMNTDEVSFHPLVGNLTPT